mgnify:CR=1 FL=1
MTIYPERWRVEGEAFRAWGEIDYIQPLLPCEVADYELRPYPDIRRKMDAQAQIVGAWEDAKTEAADMVLSRLRQLCSQGAYHAGAAYRRCPWCGALTKKVAAFCPPLCDGAAGGTGVDC